MSVRLTPRGRRVVTVLEYVVYLLLGIAGGLLLSAWLTPAVAIERPSVVSMNVCSRHCDWLAPFPERAPEIASRLTTTEPDVVTLQEVGRLNYETHDMDVAMAGHGYSRAAGSNARYIYVRNEVTITASGTEVFSRPSDNRTFAFPWVTVKGVTVADLHLAPDDGVAGDEDRLFQVRHLEGILPVGKKILIGDYNAISERNPTNSDVAKERWRVHQYLTDNGWGRAIPDRSTFLGGPETEGIRLGELSFDRAYFRGTSGHIQVLDTGDLSDHLAVEVRP